MTNRRILISGITALGLAAPLLASTASTAAATSGRTIDLYGVTQSQVLQNAHRKAISPDTEIAVGDYIVKTKKVYKGTQGNHAAIGDGTVTTRCHVVKLVTQSKGTTACTATWSAGGSTLTAGPITAPFQGPQKHFTLNISNGTGTYAGAHGTWTVTRLNKNGNEFVLHLSA